MQNDDFVSDEEREWRADQELELLMNDPGYRLASWEEFSADRKKKVITAKRLWLQFTEKGQAVPTDIVAVLFDAIKKEIIDYDINHAPANGQIHNRLRYEHAVFELLNTAKTKEYLDHFWKLLHGPTDSLFDSVETHQSDILKILRGWLPERRKFKRKEIYAIFEALFEDPPISPKVESSEAFQQKFREWRDKNIKPFKSKT